MCAKIIVIARAAEGGSKQSPDFVTFLKKQFFTKSPRRENRNYSFKLGVPFLGQIWDIFSILRMNSHDFGCPVDEVRKLSSLREPLKAARSNLVFECEIASSLVQTKAPRNDKLRNVFFALLVLFLPLSGCAPIFVGAGVAGGYAMSRDYIQGETDKDYNSLCDSAEEVAGTLGIIQSKFKNPSLAKLKVKVESSSLDIDIVRLTQKTSRLKVHSRKNMLPNLELAQNAYNRILQFTR